STLKSPSYTKSVSWQHYLPNEINLFLYYHVFPEARDWVSRGWLL
ncbi:transposase, partial [Shigella flexneri]